GFADRAANMKAVPVGHPDIKNGQVRRPTCHGGQSIPRQGDVLDLKALTAQGVEQGVGDGWLVFKQKDVERLHSTNKSASKGFQTISGAQPGTRNPYRSACRIATTLRKP